MNEKILPLVEKVEQRSEGAQNDHIPIVGGGSDVSAVPLEMTKGEIRETLVILA